MSTNSLAIFGRILQKDLRLEFRGGQFFLPQLSLSLLLTFLCYFGVSGAFLEPPDRLRMFPSLLWLIFIVSATVSSERAMRGETALRAIDGLLLSRAPLALAYMSKLLVHSVLSFFAFIPATLLLAEFCGTRLPPPLWVISAAVIFAHSALSLLLAPLSISSRMQVVLLPLLALPLLFPLYLGATELFLASLLSEGALVDSPWLSVIICLAVLYPALGAGLFRDTFS